ncbi:helix-turn-helix domain-containing protein [Tautonia sp. JC769]|uniref:winged helix-turn-helix transcriptional regulator n=1 Tax=Tautonia sp. JC769 TaxID=3232135 RepID=UPI0034577A22
MTRPSKRRSPCPVSCTLDLIGDKWTMLVIRDLMCGKSQFVEFCRSPEGIATNILADRLQRLVEHGLVEKAASDEESRRDRYRLTAKGKSLRAVLDAIAHWGLANIEGTEARLKPKEG